MASLLFEIGRYSAFLGVFFFLLFGISLWMFRRGLEGQGLSLIEQGDIPEGEIERGAVDMSGTVHYLRRRDYELGSAGVQSLGGQYRNRIVWPFYLGVWSFCLGLFLMSITFGFVLFE